MNILFICMSWPKLGGNNLYTDLMDEFVQHGHQVYVATLCEKRNGLDTSLLKENNMKVLRVKCGNIQKTNKYEKVISSFVGGYQLERAVKKYYADVKVDIMVFALPPLTITLPLLRLKKFFNTELYLLLKEFWPQDPVDLKAMRKGGLVWQVFRFLEKKLYRYCEYIGTMSSAGIAYVQSVSNTTAKLEVCPNSQKYYCLAALDEKVLLQTRTKYGIKDECVFIFGGNLGLSQGIPELIQSIKSVSDIKEALFLIIGDGTEKNIIVSAIGKQDNVMILDRIPQKDFDLLTCACDVGLIFLNPNYSIPNFPSRMVSYLAAGLPVIACIDKATDVGTILEQNCCGISMSNGDTENFREAVLYMLNKENRISMKKKSRQLFETDYTAQRSYEIIEKHLTSTRK